MYCISWLIETFYSLSKLYSVFCVMISDSVFCVMISDFKVKYQSRHMGPM